MKLLKLKNLRVYIVISAVFFIAFLVVLFFYLSSPTTGGDTYKIVDTKTFLVNTKQRTNIFKYTLNLDLEKILKDIKFYQFKVEESIDLKSKAITKYSLDTTKLPSVKVVGNKSIALFSDHIDIFSTVQLTENDTSLYESDQKLKDIITNSLSDLGVTIPEGYTIRKSYLHDDGNEATAVNKAASNILSLSVFYLGEENSPIKININQKGDVQRIVLQDKLSVLTKEEIKTNAQALPLSFYTKTNIDKYGSFDSYLPKLTNEINTSEIVYFTTKENLLLPFLRLSDTDNTVSIIVPVIDPTKIIYQ